MKKHRPTMEEALRQYELLGPSKMDRAALNIIRDAAVQQLRVLKAKSVR